MEAKMSQLKKRDKMCESRETRWDRIRRRQSSVQPFTLKSVAVRHFFELDYVGKQQQQRLIHGTRGHQLNPTVVMDLRHKMFKQIPRQLPLATVRHMHKHDSCKMHNMNVEQRFISNELGKLRAQLQRQHKRNQLKFQLRPAAEPELKLDNTQIVASLASTTQHIKDFYTAPVEAFEAAAELYAERELDMAEQEAELDMPVAAADQSDLEAEELDLIAEIELNLATDVAHQFIAEAAKETNTLDEVTQADDIPEEYYAAVSLLMQNNEELQRLRTPSPLTPTEEFFKPMRAAAERQMLHMRCVRFEEEVAIRNIQRETSSCSNTSDGIDSVISDLAEEALLELRMEAEQQEEQVMAQTHVESEAVLNVNQVDAMLVVEATTTEMPQEKLLKAAQPPAKQQQSIKDEPLLIRGKEWPKVVIKPQSPDDALPKQSMATETSSEEAQQQEHKRIIEELYQKRAQNSKATIRKYFRMWVHFTIIERLERDNCKLRADRAQKINAFLDKVRKEKHRIKQKQTNDADGHAESSAKKHEQREEALKMAKQYKNKIKVQQDIIDLQRVKLERQERMIMELKLHKLSDEANEARQELKQELKTVIRYGDPKSKAKAKCLQLIGSLRDAEDEHFARLQGKALLQPKFLQNMQERALERSVRHEQARQRRQQADAEREAQKTAAEEAKRLEDEEAKRLRIEVLKEKRRQEKMAKVLKERERQRALEHLRLAKEHSRRLLLRRVGMECFKRMLQRKRENQAKCDALQQRLYQRNYMNAWHEYTAFVLLQKQAKANACHERALQRHALAAWHDFVQEARSKMLVAIDWHALKLVEIYFTRWGRHTQREKLIEETKMRQASSHHDWHLKWKVIDCWQRLPQILQIEQETEERRQRWRMKIWELLPDYKPNREDNLW